MNGTTRFADPSRRAFLRQSLSCGAHLSLAALAAPGWWRRTWAQEPRGRIVAEEPFGRLEQVAEGVWALISTPLGGDQARVTVANGGLIAGRTGVLAIEGFFQPQGAAWLAARSLELTGRWPTDVVLTHYHADHVNGLAGYRSERHRSVLRATATTRELALARNQPADAARSDALATLMEVGKLETEIDLGGRVVRVIGHAGHTPSDLVVILDDPAVTFCGDLVWNGMFPNYVDAVPSALSRAVRSLSRGGPATYVPGHGPLGGDRELRRYLDLLDAVEDAARQAHRSGTPAQAAAAAFTLPPAIGEWTRFAPAYYERAFLAWYRELET